MKKQLFLLLMMLSPVVAMAYDAEIDGIYYNFNGTEATVTSGDNKYSGSIVIPAVVTYNETEYPVVSIGDYAFKYCYNLSSVTIPNSVTIIEYGAFQYCSSLSSITIPNSVTSIEGYVFYHCSGLNNITIPSSVTSIGFSVFEGCCGLSTIAVEDGNSKYDSRNNCNAIIETSSNTLLFGCKNTSIPNSVTSIWVSAFRDCTDLSSITIPDNVTSIGHYAFMNCTGVSSITIPNSVTSIGEKAFAGCNGLTSITIPDNVTSISKSVFEGCSGLTSISIPNSITNVGESAFEGCSGLASITIPSCVTSIGEYAFTGCSNLTDVYCNKETVPSTDSKAFYYTPTDNITLHVHAASIDAYQATIPWSGFKEIVSLNIDFVDANVKAICVANWDTDGDGELSEAEAAAVTSLGTVFQNNNQITSFDELKYFTGLNSIEDYAFFGCYCLTSVTIPNSVTSIETHSFSDCGLTSITIPNSVISIGRDAFLGCTNLTSFLVEDDNTSYASEDGVLFDKAKKTLIEYPKGNNRTHYVIPNKVMTVGDDAFSGCYWLTSVTIPNSVTSIGKYAFDGCGNLASVTIPSSVTSIGYSAFGQCGLTAISVEEGNTKYDSRNNCNAIIETSSSTLIAGCKNTTIPNSVTTIGDHAFYGCWGVTSFTIPNNVTSIGEGSFSNCGNLTTITIPNSVTSIGEGAFFGCIRLTSVTIPNDVTSIGEKTFAYCSSLASVTIPNSVTSIGYMSFFGCTDLTDFYCYAKNVPTTHSDAFGNTTINNITLHVPASSIDSYQTTSPWSDFKEIVAISQDIAMATSSGSPRSMKGYSSEYGLDFTNVSDVKAYIAVGFTGEKNVILASVNIVPANTGMILRTDNPGVEVDVPITNSEVYYANLLKPALNNVTIQPTETIGGVDYTNLMVGTDSSTGQLGFITFSNAVTRSNSCYLSVPTTFFQSAASARQGGLDMIFIDSETTTDIQSLMQSGIITDDIYDLQGRKVTATKKGLYIRNGKKVYVK